MMRVSGLLSYLDHKCNKVVDVGAVGGHYGCQRKKKFISTFVFGVNDDIFLVFFLLKQLSLFEFVQVIFHS